MSDAAPVRTVGFIGLGNMGFPMAANLAARGFAVIVSDLDASACARFVEAHGGEAAAGPAEAAAKADALVLMLPDGNVVREVLLGAPDAAAGLRPGSLVVDMSSSDPTGTCRLGEDLAARGAALVDAPVSGGVPRARSGKLAVIVGGEADAVARARPLLETMGSSIAHVGPLGAGHAMKALNNYVSAAGLLAACEALRIAENFGIDSATAVEVLNASTGRNNSTENKLMQYVVSRKFDSGFSLGLMRKDLATALKLAGDVKVAPPMGEHLLGLWEDAQTRYGKAADHTEIARLVEPDAQ